jgi:hypothetical protein
VLYEEPAAPPAEAPIVSTAERPAFRMGE